MQNVTIPSWGGKEKKKKKRKIRKNQYVEINVPLWRFKTDGEKVRDSLLLSAFLWQLQCVCYEWAVICSSCWIIKGAAFPSALGVLFMAYLLFLYPSLNQSSTGKTQWVPESFSQSQRATHHRSGWVWTAQCVPWRMVGELSKEIREINLDPIMQLNLCAHGEIFYDAMILWCWAVLQEFL